MLKKEKSFFSVSILLICCFFILSVSGISASSVDEEFKKLANYAGEYETGNINYIQLLTYSSSIRANMNEILGATGKEMGGIVKEEQISSILGEPLEETNWVWSEGQQKETRLDKDVPVWKKIVFDGRKIQIRLNAWPSIFSKKQMESDDEKDKKNIESKFADLEGKLIYRLNFEIEFKKPAEQLDIEGKIEDVKNLAKSFSENPSLDNAETLAKESVNVERTFESYFRQIGGKCEDVMDGIFGSENKRQTQKMLVREIDFCEGENFNVIAKLEMCDDCEWNWINLNFDVRGRGPMKMDDSQGSFDSQKNYEKMSVSELQGKIASIIDEVKQACVNGNFNSIRKIGNKIWPINEAWNQKSNNVWEEIDKTFKAQTEAMTQEERQIFDQSYGWIKQEQEKRQKVRELGKSNYESRKQFYFNIFSGYESKDSYFTQIEYQKRLIEEFMENGQELCDNNLDDNANQAIDCADDQCGGKICGKGMSKVSTGDGNETGTEKEVNFYCIEKICQAREESKPEIIISLNESNFSVCPELEAITCEEGSKVFFSKYNPETNCPIETKCLKEEKSCSANEDCAQPACGISECVENKCIVTQLTECKESECADGDKKMCESDGKISELCNNGFWEKVDECLSTTEIVEDIVVGGGCLTAGDCGENGVCNNGVCQILPQVIMVEPEEPEEGEEPEEKEDLEQEQSTEQEDISEPEQQSATEPQEQQEQSEPQQEESSQENEPQEQESEESSPESSDSSESSSPEITGSVIAEFIETISSKVKILGAMITGFAEDISEPEQQSATEPQEQQEQSEPQQEESSQLQEGEQPSRDESQQDENLEVSNPDNSNQYNEERRDEQDDERREQEDEERQAENKERCKKDCARPCVEKCIKDGCGDDFECEVNDLQLKCEESCVANEECINKCMSGDGDWWKEFENKEEFKKEKGVFQVGGTCRSNQGKTEGFVWFGGWGDPFEEIQNLKNKYYSGGQADWCKYDFENLMKQRKEFEEGFNQDFLTWFFEKYLANSAEDWEQSVSGIFELYWKDVDNAREMAYRMQCLGTTELSGINLINVKYETAYGSVEFWEELNTVRLEGMDQSVQVITPYMKAWVFPPKKFMIYEIQKAMKNHEFPGSPEEKIERKNEEGPTAEEREMIKQNEKFMNYIREISDKFGGNLDIVVQLKDYETNEIVFNLYAQINENDILKLKPLLPEEVSEQDAKIEIDFDTIYNLIYDQEKGMSGQRVESPPWGQKLRPVQKIKEIFNGIQMYFKMKSIINSAVITPVEYEDDIRGIVNQFMTMMMSGDRGSGSPDSPENSESRENSNQNNVLESADKITGKIIFR